MLQQNEDIYYRVNGSKKARRGKIIGERGGGYIIQTRRDAKSYKAPVVFVPEESVWDIPTPPQKSTTPDFTSKYRQRAVIGYQRFGVTENEVLQHPRVLTLAKSILSLLAAQNDCDRNYIIHNGSLHNPDHIAMELYSDYMLALLISLRHETSHAPESDLQQFREHLGGIRTDSRIMTTITFAGRGAAIRAAIRTSRCADISYDTVADDYMNIVPQVENDINSWAEIKHGIASALRQLRHVDRTGVKIIMTKFALGSGQLLPLSNATVAALLNEKKIPPSSGKKWTRNTVSSRVNMTLDALRQKSGNLFDLWREGITQ